MLDAWQEAGRDRTSGSVQPLLAARAPLTRLIGRNHDIERLVALLRGGARLITLTGPGGVGKTRLALATADRIGPHFARGVVVVDLSSLRDTRLVLATMAQALGLPDTGDQPYAERLVSHLRQANQLLVLDNMEHVAEAAPELADILTTCPGVSVLATSRVPLRVRAEHEVAVTPLTLPAGSDLSDLRVLAEVPSVALLLDRARAVAPWVRADGCRRGRDRSSLYATGRTSAGARARCRLGAGAASAALLARLEHALALLVEGPRDLPPRQRALRATIDWSFLRLSQVEQRLFARLSVFAGGFTLSAAELVAATMRPITPC